MDYRMPLGLLLVLLFLLTAPTAQGSAQPLSIEDNDNNSTEDSYGYVTYNRSSIPTGGFTQINRSVGVGYLTNSSSSEYWTDGPQNVSAHGRHGIPVGDYLTLWSLDNDNTSQTSSKFQRGFNATQQFTNNTSQLYTRLLLSVNRTEASRLNITPPYPVNESLVLTAYQLAGSADIQYTSAPNTTRYIWNSNDSMRYNLSRNVTNNSTASRDNISDNTSYVPLDKKDETRGIRVKIGNEWLNESETDLKSPGKIGNTQDNYTYYPYVTDAYITEVFVRPLVYVHTGDDSGPYRYTIPSVPGNETNASAWAMVDYRVRKNIPASISNENDTKSKRKVIFDYNRTYLDEVRIARSLEDCSGKSKHDRFESEDCDWTRNKTPAENFITKMEYNLTESLSKDLQVGGEGLQYPFNYQGEIVTSYNRTEWSCIGVNASQNASESIHLRPVEVPNGSGGTKTVSRIKETPYGDWPAKKDTREGFSCPDQNPKDNISYRPEVQFREVKTQVIVEEKTEIVLNNLNTINFEWAEKPNGNLSVRATSGEIWRLMLVGQQYGIKSGWQYFTSRSSEFTKLIEYNSTENGLTEIKNVSSPLHPIETHAFVSESGTKGFPEIEDVFETKIDVSKNRDGKKIKELLLGEYQNISTNRPELNESVSRATEVVFTYNPDSTDIQSTFNTESERGNIAVYGIVPRSNKTFNVSVDDVERKVNGTYIKLEGVERKPKQNITIITVSVRDNQTDEKISLSSQNFNPDRENPFGENVGQRSEETVSFVEIQNIEGAFAEADYDGDGEYSFIVDMNKTQNTSIIRVRYSPRAWWNVQPDEQAYFGSRESFRLQDSSKGSVDSALSLVQNLVIWLIYLTIVLSAAAIALKRIGVIDGSTSIPIKKFIEEILGK